MAEPQVEKTIEPGAEVSIASKNQKKALKALKATGIKKVDGIFRVVLRKRQGPTFVIEKPDVYRTPNGSYIVFGEAQVQQQDMAQQLASLTGQEGAAAGAGGETDKSPESIQADLAANAEKLKINDAEEIPDDQVDVGDLDEEKIQMVVDQANVSKAKAVHALKQNNGDLVNALMQLTS